MADRAEAELYRDVARAVTAMEAYAEQVVLCGGWVPRFYRTMAEFSPSAFEPDLSWDMDWVLPNRLPVAPEGDLGAVLRANALVGIGSRDRDPPVVRFQGQEFGSENLAPVHVDLLTPLTGSPIGRHGEDKTLQEVQNGLRAQALRYLELHFFEPMRCDASATGDLRLPRPIIVRVPNPMAFVLQKALSAPLREQPGKRDKDFVYIYDVALLSRPLWPNLRETLDRIQSARGEWANWANQARRMLERAFGGPDADGCRAVEKQMRTQTPAPAAAAVHRAMMAFRAATGLGLPR